jgi:DNA polymerase III delta subunit
MIYLLHGTDVEKARTKTRELSDALHAKRPDAAFFRMDAEHWNPAELEEYCGGQGLFENKFIIVLDRLSENEEIAPQLIEKIELIAVSPNIFIVFEGKLNSEALAEFEKHAEKIQEFAQVTPKSVKFTDRFNVFSLAEALGNRDRKNLWLLYRRALDNEIAPEEIHGTLFWQAKSIALARASKSASDAGMKDFPFNKAKGYARNFSETESSDLLSRLIRMSHDARRGMGDLGLALEELALSV